MATAEGGGDLWLAWREGRVACNETKEGPV